MYENEGRFDELIYFFSFVFNVTLIMRLLKHHCQMHHRRSRKHAEQDSKKNFVISVRNIAN